MKAINCKTKDEFKRVLEIFEEKGWTWRSGHNPLYNDHVWFILQERTYIDYHDMFGYGAVDAPGAAKKQIISFEEFLQLEYHAKSFPRKMLVSDDNNAPLREWERLTVLGYAEGAEFPWIVTGDDLGEYFGYKHAKDVEEKEREAIELLESKGYKVTK